MTEQEDKKLAEQILLYRQIKGLSQEQLANKAGVSRPYVNFLERGKQSKPSAIVLYKLAAALGATIEDLLNFPYLSNEHDPKTSR